MDNNLFHKAFVFNAGSINKLLTQIKKLLQQVFLYRQASDEFRQSFCVQTHLSGQSMGGVTHIFGGALAVNLGPLLNAVQSTLGLSTFGITFY